MYFKELGEYAVSRSDTGLCKHQENVGVSVGEVSTTTDVLTPKNIYQILEMLKTHLFSSLSKSSKNREVLFLMGKLCMMNWHLRRLNSAVSESWAKTWGKTYSLNLPYSKGIGSPEVAIPLLNVM